jgi:hypothetical protein
LLFFFFCFFFSFMIFFLAINKQIIAIGVQVFKNDQPIVCICIMRWWADCILTLLFQFVHSRTKTYYNHWVIVVCDSRLQELPQKNENARVWYVRTEICNKDSVVCCNLRSCWWWTILENKSIVETE